MPEIYNFKNQKIIFAISKIKLPSSVNFAKLENQIYNHYGKKTCIQLWKKACRW